jgi:DnaJ-class molecular chaperone
MINSYYGILGITKISNKKEIISAFRRLARKYHPDVNSKNSYNEKKFKEINEAYQVLSDEKSRKDYDDFGEQWRYADQIRSNQINNNFKFNNFFNFNSSSRSNFEEKQVHKMEISVSLKELYLGTKRIILLKDKTNCIQCDNFEKSNSSKCTVCNGKGKILESKKIELNIPKGLKDGGLIKVKTPDSRIINFYVKQVLEENFIRKGNDLYTKVELNYLDAILGGEVILKTLNKPISLKIPPGTKNSSLFKIQDKGMPIINSDKFGSLIVEVNIIVPSKVSNEEKSILEDLRVLNRGSNNAN